jgi:hypothetical protein
VPVPVLRCEYVFRRRTSALRYGARVRLLVSASLVSSLIAACCIIACGSDDPASSSSPDGGAPTTDAAFAPTDAPDRDAGTRERRACKAAEPGTGDVDRNESYWNFCSPTCGDGQFCFKTSDVPMSPMDFDAGDVSAQTFELDPQLCNGCHPLEPCDGGDPCACLRAQLPSDVCGPEAGSQCRVRDGRLQFRCLAITAL